jgi:hypothetical protein
MLLPEINFLFLRVIVLAVGWRWGPVGVGKDVISLAVKLHQNVVQNSASITATWMVA